MKKIVTLIAGILFFCGMSQHVNAQEKTAAGVYNEGLSLLKEKNYTDGLKLMEEAIVLAEASENEKVLNLAMKNGAVAASNMGNTSYKAKDFEAALGHYLKGLELNPQNSSNAIGKARVLGKQEKSLEAIAAYADAADIYMKSDKADRAEKALKQAQNIVGKLYVAKDYTASIEAGESFLSRNENAEVRYYMSRSLTEGDSNEKALEHISKAIELSTAAGEVNDKYYMAQGQSLENLGRKNEALASYQKVQGEKYKAQAEYKIGKIKA